MVEEIVMRVTVLMEARMRGQMVARTDPERRTDLGGMREARETDQTGA